MYSQNKEKKAKKISIHGSQLQEFWKKMSNQQIIPTMLNLIVHKLADTH